MLSQDFPLVSGVGLGMGEKIDGVEKLGSLEGSRELRYVRIWIFSV